MQILRIILASWAVLQFLFVVLVFGMACSDFDGPDGFNPVGFLLGLFPGALFGAISVFVPWGIFKMCQIIWSMFADEEHPAAHLTTSDIAGIAATLHPTTGAILHATANAEARTQALSVTPPAAPDHNLVDDERL